jgi:septal ring factor EnvC (AmiA/AmiB activator)
MSSKSMASEIALYVGPVVAAMAGAVAALWKQQETRNAKQIEDMRQDLEKCAQQSHECYEDRLKLNQSVARLEERVNQLHPSEGAR